MTDELEKRPARALKEAAFLALSSDDEVKSLLPDDGHAIVQKPTTIRDSNIADACVRVSLASDASTPRGTIDQHTHLLQVQYDTTRSHLKRKGPQWEDHIHDAVDDVLSRLGGRAFTALGKGGSTSLQWRDDKDRYVGDITYRYRTADVRESIDTD